MSYTEDMCLPWWSAASVYGVERCETRQTVIRFYRGGKLPDGMNAVRTAAQLDNRTTQRGMISQAHNITVHCFHGGKQ